MRTIAYVAGAGHSGSTFFSLLLDSAPEVFSIGEMHAPQPIQKARNPAEERCSCGERIVDCPFLREVTRRLAAEGIAFEPLDWSLEYDLYAHPRVNQILTGSLRSNALEALRSRLDFVVPGHRRRLRALDHVVERFMHVALDITGARVFADASKDPNRIRHLMRIPGFDLKVVHLVRDPRGVAYSYWKQSEEAGAGAAQAWLSANRATDRLVRLLPGSASMRLRYEDLCRDPASALATVGEHLGIGPIALPADFRAGEHHIQGGNKSRLPTDARKEIKLDEKWREALTPDQLAAVARTAGPLARQYGYAI